MRKIVLLEHIKVINANAMSSPVTIGLPSMTSWMGFMHALNRNLNERKIDISFSGVGVVIHKLDIQNFKDSEGKYEIVLQRKPLVLKKKDRSFGTPSFIPEARCHIDVSLILDIENDECLKIVDEEKYINSILQNIMRMKIAGGDIISVKDVSIMTVEEEIDFKRIKYRLRGGNVIISRTDLMSGEGDSLENMLDKLAIHRETIKDGNGDFIGEWYKKEIGWLVPISVGFRGITPICEVKNQRSYEYPHRFAENILTLGEFKMIHRFKNLDEILWCYKYCDNDNGMYLCVNNEKQPGNMSIGFLKSFLSK